MTLGRRPQQQRRRVDGAAADDDGRGLDAFDATALLDLDGDDARAGGIREEPADERAGPQRDVGVRRRRIDAADLGVALRADPARERIARAAEHAAAGLARPADAERQMRRVQAESAQPLDDGGHARRVRHRRKRIRSVRRLRRIVADGAVHFVHRLGAVVVRRQRLVVDRPRRRDAVGVLEDAEILAAQPVEHAAPELRVAADAVVRVRRERLPFGVEPLLDGAIAQLAPHRFGAPVLRLARDAAAPFEHEDPRAASRRAHAPSCRRRRPSR